MASLIRNVMCLLLAGVTTVQAASDCSDAGLMNGEWMSSFCYECLFPLRIATVPSQPAPLPLNVTEEESCSCDGESIGVTVGSWHPVRIIEVVTTPGCSPLLGGINLFPGLMTFRGTVGQGDPLGEGHAFFHVHSFPFPWINLLDPFSNTPCRSLNDSAPPYYSETDPTWNMAELSWIDGPDALFTGTPPAVAACAADAIASNAGMPDDLLSWCAGSWGLMNPLAGSMRSTLGTDPSLTSLAAIRHQALLHRRGIGLQTTGDLALCGGVPTPFMQKSQYRMSRIYPVPEPLNHAIGASTLQWASAPLLLVPGQPTLYILWRWEDCCIPVY